MFNIGSTMNKTISVYFCGSGFSIDKTSLTAELFNLTVESTTQIKMGFNGCGIDYGFTGNIFGSGLDEQCKKVIDRVIQEINDGHQVTLNVYGHSRGGIAALLLAKQLSDIDKEKLAINLALLDPVPGNLMTTAYVDPCNISLANKSMDLSGCKPLRKVLALYPHKPMFAIMCHAPLLASYPQETEVDEEAINGCHSDIEEMTTASNLAHVRVMEFLIINGTELRLNENEVVIFKNADRMKRLYLRGYAETLRYVTETPSKKTHSARGMVITTTPEARYLNTRHRSLANGSLEEPVRLSIQVEKGLFTALKRFFTNYPLVGQALKWTLITLSITSLVYFTGGLAAIVFLAPIVSKLGALSLLVFSPVIGGALAALWYGAVTPLLSWWANKFVYPHYAIRTIAPPRIEIQDSTTGLMEALGVDRSPTNSPYPMNSQDLPQRESPLHTVVPVGVQELQPSTPAFGM